MGLHQTGPEAHSELCSSDFTPPLSLWGLIEGEQPGPAVQGVVGRRPVRGPRPRRQEAAHARALTCWGRPPGSS